MNPSFYFFEPKVHRMPQGKADISASSEPEPFSITAATAHDQDERQYPTETAATMFTTFSSASETVAAAAAQQEDNGQAATTATAFTTKETTHEDSPPFKIENADWIEGKRSHLH